MPITLIVKHSKVSTVPDVLDDTVVRPSDWNANHTITGTDQIDAGLAAKSDVGHGHIIADVTSLQSTLDLKAPLASPALTGTPIAPTAAPDTNTTQLATTAFVAAATAEIPNKVIAPGTNTANRVPRWDGANSKTLVDGLDIGTAANNLVQLTAAAKLPGVDGSLLTGVTSASTLKLIPFITNGTYTPSANMIAAILFVWGGGGGGGGVAGAVGWSLEAGAGGAGAFSIKRVTAADIGASKAVTIGAPGSGGAAGLNTGGTGGASSVGTLCTANGGIGGTGTSNGSAGNGGAGGAAATGDVSTRGNGGARGRYDNTTTAFAYTSQGGATALGGVSPPNVAAAGATAGGAAGANSGSGGNGAAVHNSATNAAGGDGAAGLAFILEICGS